MSNYRDILYRNYSATFAEQKPFNIDVQYAQYDAIYPVLRDNKHLNILDLGCGRGEWLSWMSSKGYKLLSGVDLSEADLQKAQSNSFSCQWHLNDAASHMKSHEHSYDIIHAKDIIEHLTKDEFIEFLQSAKQALKHGGELWMLTFNAQSPLASATRYGDYTHESAFTPSSIAQCLRACGYENISVRGIHHCTDTIGGKIRRILGIFVYAAARLALKIRHGNSISPQGIDQHCAEPDLFIKASKD